MIQVPQKKLFRILFILFIIPHLISPSGLYAQKKKAHERKELEMKRKDLEGKINYTQKLLREAEDKKKISINDLTKIDKEISFRKELIQTIRIETHTLQKEIEETEQIVHSLQKDIRYLKNQYARQVYNTYKNMNELTALMLIFSSSSFNQAVRRIKYLGQLSAYRKMQIAAIRKTQFVLGERIAELEKIKIEKITLLDGEIREKKELDEAHQEKNLIIKSLSHREKELRNEIAIYRKTMKDLDALLAKLIKTELEKNKKLRETPEYKLESDNFMANRGKLPWPVGRGIITSSFGKQQYGEFENVFLENNGIDITTEKNELVRAVYDGEVSLVASVPGLHNVVVIRHGEYRTVYANLKEIYVSQGDKIQLKQNIGIAGENKRTGDTQVHFELWKETFKQDPAGWLAE